MKINVRRRDDITILEPQGRLTIGEGDIALRNAIQHAIESGTRSILLNMGSVTTIDSSGIGELVSSYTRAQQRNIALKLSNLPSKISDILHITQLITVFDVYESEDEALMALR